MTELVRAEKELLIGFLSGRNFPIQTAKIDRRPCPKKEYAFAFKFKNKRSELESQIALKNHILNQEKIRGQRGTLPDQALGYVKFGKVIFRRPFATEV